MIEQGGGAIVNVASVNAFFHPDGLVVDYGAAKAALLNVAKALSQELGPQGIRINSVFARAGRDRPVARRARRRGDDRCRAKGTDGETVHQQAAASLPTGRFTTPEEVATLVTLLASPRTANVTGSNYIIDGGLVKTM